MRYGAVIIATSMTKRLKQYKDLMSMGPAGIAERVIVNFRRAGVSDIVMVTGQDHEKLEKSLRHFDISFIRNDDFENSDMFASARLGLECLRERCDRAFFCPVDIPFFTDQTVSDQMRMMDLNSSAKVIVPSLNGQGGHPILISADAIPGILSYSGEHGMRGAYGALPAGSVIYMSVRDEGAVTRSGMADDYRKLVDAHNDRIMHPVVKLTFASTSGFFGPGAVRLLKEIDNCGNVRDACEKCGFSYSKGWTLIRNCEEKLGYSIVSRQAGGESGGSARVTDKGRDLITAYEELSEELDRTAEERFKYLMRKYQLATEKAASNETDKN